SPKDTLSRTLRCGKSAKCWKTVVVGRLCGGRSTSDCPSRTISPPVGYSCPPIMRSVVVFPQPDGPSRTTYSPWSTCRFTSSTASVPPGKTFVRPIRSSPDPEGAEGAVTAAPSAVVSAVPSAMQYYALRKSFQRLTWYVLFVKYEFQDE